MITLSIELSADCVEATELELLAALLESGSESTNIYFQYKIEEVTND